MSHSWTCPSITLPRGYIWAPAGQPLGRDWYYKYKSAVSDILVRAGGIGNLEMPKRLAFSNIGVWTKVTWYERRTPEQLVELDLNELLYIVPWSVEREEASVLEELIKRDQETDDWGMPK